MRKVFSFVKKNIYYFLLAFCLIAIATIIFVGVNQKNQNPDDNSTVVNNPQPVEQNPNENDPNENDDTQQPPTAVVFDVPVKSGTIGLDYSNSTAVFNQTMKREEMHLGVDFLADIGENVYTTYDGVVSASTYDVLFGGVISISHDNGTTSVYKSLDKNVNVQVGDRVRKGDIIGQIGSSLFEVLEGPHLHFELHQNGERISPYDYFLESEK